MKKKYPFITLIFSFLLVFSVFAQRPEGQELKFTGTVVDGSINKPMAGANILVKTVTDSLLRGGVTDGQGKFEVIRPDIPQVKVEITFIGYRTVTKIHSIREPLNLGEIVLLEDTKVLGEVIIEGQVPVGEMKGDTTSFNANAFKTQENAQAEDLIRKMPGITMQGGQIQAQGEAVQKILVDGREFFGNDPNIALRNLPADAIDRVEVLDQRSDQSRLTGFDDGNYTKTINIILREDRKNGQFGRVYGGYGTDDRYSAGGSLNLFSGDRRVSILGLFNNVNQQNFSSQDLAGLSANASGGRGGGGGRWGGGGNNNFFVGGSGGIVGTNAMGLNYSDKWGKKVNFTGSYFFNNTTNTLQQITNRETVVNENFRQNYQENLINTVENFNHRANARIEADLNEKNSIILTPSISFQNNNTFSDRDALTVGSDADTLSALRSISNAETKALSISNNLTYRYKFDKPRRTFSTDINTSWSNRDQFSDLNAASNDYRRDVLDTTIQETTSINEGFNYRVNLTFTEPLGKRAIGTFGYQVSNNKTRADQKTRVFDQENLPVLDTALSNEFDNKFITQRLRTGYAYNNNGWNVNLNLDYQNARLDNEAFFPTEGVFKRDFNNILPSANINYRNRETGFTWRIRYRTNTDEPSVNELQNVVNNQNPLNLRVGNPNLGQSFNHNIFANISKVNLEKSRTLFMFVNYSSTSNFIGNSTFLTTQDTLINGEILLRPGGQISQPVNLDGNWRTRFFLTYGAPIPKLKMQFNTNTRLGFNRTPGLINGETNFNDNIDLGQGITLSSNISKNVDFSISTTGTYNIVNSSLQQDLNNNYYVQESNIRLYFSPNNGKLFVGNTVNHSLYTGLSEGFDQSFWLWNIEGGVRFAKNNKAELKVVIFDLLNQNNSISRTISDVAVTDVFTNVLTRYGMLTFTYIIGNFKQPENDGNSPWQRMRPGGGRTW
ncbi:CarboxypepD_reg-like domain-containing protein [Algoriphagus faecimaris]|uniref:CarboxypepD_reg-like domain-containing protein n=1 Tax=Algoriphagus faecimaris TaxID=686796 RepID=A0A1G6QX58_9BACT|nr:outer membrane beta-barrel protein [Algoriphagus faecimaris]SDC96337.1 CarboxypepD_reg-like domain-containing protein [Algoriphagus faecimaris]